MVRARRPLAPESARPPPARRRTELPDPRCRPTRGLQQEWLDRFETALRGLPDRQRQHSLLPLLHAFARPEKPLSGSALPADQFRAGVRAAALNKENDIPHLSQDLITKYVADLRSQRLL
ncbi:hypothetical protein [Streptomyces decoyicus]|uniref:hypothetical protein n=1 Tax=Streptomyces decoyicus TaxID=249567 RepID=UPI000A847ED3|nr:hypothetical protein [Streptomyces decoyicus]QZY13908.1 hypothetical protein K7C20_00375 [Streptomyces decoyicus]